MPSGAHCREGVCQCQDNFTYVRGKCRQLISLGQNCKDTLDCNFGYDRQSVVCKSGVCTCADGYYERYFNTCRPKSMDIKDDCVVDSDCEDIQNGNGVVKCENFHCNTATKINGNRRESREIAVQTSLEETHLKPIIETPSDEIEDTFSKDEDRTASNSNTSNTNDENGNKKYGDACDINGEACVGLTHSTCVSNSCYCNLGYYHKNGKCMAELGEIAASEDLCEFEFNPTTKVCSCVKNFFYERNLRSCRKPISINHSCTSNSQCSPFGGSECTPVVPRRCVCNDLTEYDESRQLCAYKEGIGAPCTQNLTCTIDKSMCSEGVCACIPSHVENNGICAKSVGAECVETDECQLENMECAEVSSKPEHKTCACKKGFVHFKDECLKEADDLGEDCTTNDQCKPLLASCKENKCSCEDKQHFSQNRCEDQKAVGEACSRAGECYMPEDPESVECRNSMCQCKVGYKNDPQRNQCMKVRSRKNSSGRPSALKIITFALIGSAFFITTAALKQAYY